MKHILILFSLLSSFLVVASQGFAAAPTEPVAQLEPLVDRVISVLNEQKGGGDPEATMDKLMVIAEEGFDIREMSKRVIGKKWRNLTPEQRDEFTGLFTELLKYVYVSQFGLYSGQTIEYGRQRIKGNRAQVDTAVVDSEMKIPVSYIMKLNGDKWQIYDVVAEGISLVRNYHEQFQSILRRDGFEGLTEKLEQRITELRKENGLSWYQLFPLPTLTVIPV